MATALGVYLVVCAETVYIHHYFNHLAQLVLLECKRKVSTSFTVLCILQDLIWNSQVCIPYFHQVESPGKPNMLLKNYFEQICHIQNNMEYCLFPLLVSVITLPNGIRKPDGAFSNLQCVSLVSSVSPCYQTG